MYMAQYLKRVDAIQFIVTDEQKELIRNKKPVFFEGSPVRNVGAGSYLAVLQQGENLIKIHTEQWLIRHPDGMWQILWPDQFNRFFIKNTQEEALQIGYDPFKAKSYNQPNILL